jgi:hypothetical protein
MNQIDDRQQQQQDMNGGQNVLVMIHPSNMLVHIRNMNSTGSSNETFCITNNEGWYVPAIRQAFSILPPSQSLPISSTHEDKEQQTSHRC